MPRHPDFDALLNDLLPLAERMLSEHGEFYPFGGSITTDGRHISVGTKGSSDRPQSQELIDIMTNEFRSQALERKIRAAGICFEVRVVPPGQVDKTDAIQLALEREGGDAVDVFVPYAQLSDRGFTYGELFACERTPTLLCSSIKGPNQSMKPTAPLRNKLSVFATTPCRGLSLSR